MENKWPSILLVPYLRFDMKTGEKMRFDVSLSNTLDVSEVTNLDQGAVVASVQARTSSLTRSDGAGAHPRSAIALKLEWTKDEKALPVKRSAERWFFGRGFFRSWSGSPVFFLSRKRVNQRNK